MTFITIIVTLILIYEIYKLFYMQDMIQKVNFMNEFKKLKTEEEKMFVFNNSNINPIGVIAIVTVEFLYVIALIYLLFTPLFWVAYSLIIFSIVFGLINIKTKNPIFRYIDTILTIILVLIGYVISVL